MKKILILTVMTVLGGWLKVAAQDAATLANRANQQYVLYESERDKGTNSSSMYAYLVESYNLFVKVVEAPNNSQQLVGAKNRLRAIYPNLLNAAAYYSEQKQPVKFLEAATAYIELPQMQLFRGELLNRDNNRFPALLYQAALGNYNLKKYSTAVKYFRDFLNTGITDESFVKNSYVYMHLAYKEQKKYAEQEQVLEEASKKFPVSVDFLLNLVNVHITTNNIPKLSNTIDRILAIDPNNEQVLPIKARVMERQGDNKGALEIYKRLHTLQPENYTITTALARSYYAVGVDIVNSGVTVTNDAEHAIILHRASDFLLSAKDLFLQILQKEPNSIKYMQGLAGVYQYMDMKPEYEVLTAMIDEKVPYTAFQSRLATYNEVHSQISGTDNQTFVAASKPQEAPKLVINIDNFLDSDENKVIDAGESFSVQFTVQNKGQGDAYNLRLRLSEQQGYDEFFDGPRELDGGHIPAGASKQYIFRYIVKKDLPTALAKINIYAFEQNGFDADPAELVVNTSEYAMPRLRIADYQFLASEGSAITLGSNGKLTLAVQNFGMKTARNVKLNFKLPQNIFATDTPEMVIDSLAPGDVATLNYGFLVNKRFDGDSIAVLVDVSEDTRSSYVSEAYKIKLGEYITTSSVVAIAGENQNRPKIVDKNYRIGYESDLLNNIPAGASNSHRYALIIGNEDYSMTGANAEINVPYAVNDAMIFREYCTRTFGVPDSQIKVVLNATAGLMHEQLDWLINIANTDPEAEVIFYYSGHGNNDEATKEAYLLPVDITGKNVRLGMALDDLYNRLGACNIKGAYVFLDACFSGSYKSAAPLLSQKGVRVAPKIGLPQGHTLSISSSSGDQTSSVYHEKKQGYYTYFLIKVLKDANGELTMKEWFERTNAEVKKATAMIGKMQEPQIMVSPVWGEWSHIQLKTPTYP